MRMMGMSFKDFVWAVNPTQLTVTAQRSLKETVLPFAGSAAQDLGPKKRKITGEGYFTGPDCWQQWEKLSALAEAGTPGPLQLPGQAPMIAVLDELKIIGAAGKDAVKYAFSFTEITGRAADTGTGTYTAEEGETLWDIAWRFGRSIDALTAANPRIRDIADLEPGQEVRIP